MARRAAARSSYQSVAASEDKDFDYEDSNDPKHTPPFLLKTFTMVDKSPNTNVICWNEAGDGFYVIDEHAFATTILPIYFKHKNFSSFVRQLNFYGFKKRTNTVRGCAVFTHPNFRRREVEKLALIRRKTAEQGTSVRETIAQLQKQVSELKDQYDNMRRVHNQILYILTQFIRPHDAGSLLPEKKRRLIEQNGVDMGDLAIPLPLSSPVGPLTRTGNSNALGAYGGESTALVDKDFNFGNADTGDFAAPSPPMNPLAPSLAVSEIPTASEIQQVLQSIPALAGNLSPWPNNATSNMGVDSLGRSKSLSAKNAPVVDDLRSHPLRNLNSSANRARIEVMNDDPAENGSRKRTANSAFFSPTPVVRDPDPDALFERSADHPEHLEFMQSPPFGAMVPNQDASAPFVDAPDSLSEGSPDAANNSQNEDPPAN